ncbi:unnamed protein product, partial [Rotaria sordida]
NYLIRSNVTSNYCTKSILESFSVRLRYEMAAWRLHVNFIETTLSGICKQIQA